MGNWADQKCVPCEGGIPPMEKAMAEAYLRDLAEGWTLNDGAKRLERVFGFSNMTEVAQFASALVAVAEEEGHHPEIHMGFRSARVEIWTHKIGGLHESDFILAAKADRIYAP